jgi:hypothetical protein
VQRERIARNSVHMPVGIGERIMTKDNSNDQSNTKGSRHS